MQTRNRYDKGTLNEELQALDSRLAGVSPATDLRSRCATSFLRELRQYKQDQLASNDARRH